jgi:hypothetical protein
MEEPAQASWRPSSRGRMLVKHPLLWVTMALVAMFGVAASLGDSHGKPRIATAFQTPTKTEPGPAGGERSNAAELLKKSRAPDYIADCTKKGEADLCARQRLVKAAEEQTGLQAMGVGLLFFTLCAAIAAALFAKQGALATREMASIAGRIRGNTSVGRNGKAASVQAHSSD